MAPSLGVEFGPIWLRSTDEIERAVTAFASSGDGGLIVSGARRRWSIAHRSSHSSHGTSSPRSTATAVFVRRWFDVLST